MEWKEVKLGDILNFRRGHDLPHSAMREGDIPVAGSNGIIGYHDTSTPVTPIITIGRSGNVGTPYFYEEAWAHNTTLYIDDFKGNNPKYLYYLCKTLPFANFSGGSAVPTLNRNHIHPLLVKYIPNIEDQRRIASILSSLDRKIELNNKINAQLEEMAQAIFKSWFVDFEPFKDGKFVQSEFGLIPEGWRVGTLGEYAKLKSGFAFKSSWWTDKGHKIIKIKNITELGELDLSHCSYVESANTIKAKDFIASKGTVIIAMTGATIGKFCIIPEIKNTYINQRVGKFFTIGEPMECLPFLFNTLKQERIYNEIINRGQGSAQPNISGKDVDTLSIIIPTEDIISQYNQMAKSFFEKILSNKQENDHLAHLRDTLLPKLMNGEIEI